MTRTCSGCIQDLVFGPIRSMLKSRKYQYRLELPDSYLEEVIIFLNKDIQESEKGRGGKPDDVVIVAFNFPYKQPAQALFGLTLKIQDTALHV